MFCVKNIEHEHMDELINLWIERHVWLKEHNKEMWKLDQLNKESIIEKYECPKWYIAYDDTEIVGGFLLIEHDRRYWPDNINEKAYYIHKFVVRTGCGGKGYSDKMLEWIKSYGRENGKKFVRLDYEKQRGYLRALYLRQGFEDIEVLTYSNGNEIVKAECRI